MSEIKLFILFFLIGVIEVIKKLFKETALCRNGIFHGCRYRILRQFNFSRMQLCAQRGLCQQQKREYD